MYETTSQNLTELMMFAILGFVLGALYEPIRISRLFVKTGTLATAIEDFLFLSVCGVIVFAYSLEFGAGAFRLFYLAGLLFGGVVYFLTVGKLISIITTAFANAIKAAVKYVINLIHKRILLPIWQILVKYAQKTSPQIRTLYEIIEKRTKHLKNTAVMRYNSGASNLRKSRNNKNHETKTVIKAKVRKAGEA
ncbi:MAG: spore cortex biosynthesis protein YabQ [Oscillospiraceae bacterium]|nr:spore cortex biosynthesis protein YabQ [Oscillospiraceae bacterium]